MDKLKVEYVSIDSIKPYARNAKQHPQEQVEQIKRSIEEFGFNDPIAIWNNEIVEGHGRLLAAQELGLSDVPIIRLDELTDEQRKAYALVHNKLTMNSGFDFATLELEIEDLSIDLEPFGFAEDLVSPDDLDDFFAPADKKEKEPKQVQCPHCGEWFTP